MPIPAPYLLQTMPNESLESACLRRFHRTQTTANVQRGMNRPDRHNDCAPTTAHMQLLAVLLYTHPNALPTLIDICGPCSLTVLP